MNEMRLTFSEWRAIVSVGHAASTDAVAPVIMGVQVTFSDGMVQAVATDRYRVARVRFTPEIVQDIADGFEVIIPAKELAAFYRATVKDTASETVLSYKEIESGIPDISWHVERGTTATGGVAIRGNYPLVGKLMPDENTTFDGVGTVCLKPAFLATLEKLHHPADSRTVKLKDLAWSFNLRESEPGSGKPAPVYVTRKSDGAAHTRELENGATLEYLVQPNLLLN